MQQAEQKNDSPTMADTFHLTYFLVNVHVAVLTPFLRYGFGAAYPGIFGLFAMILILTVASCDPSNVMVGFFCLWLAVLAWQRAQTATLLRQGRQIYSKWSGFPWLAMSFPLVRTETTATVAIEPVLCLAVGAALIPLSEALAGLVMAGFLTLPIKNAIEFEVSRKRLMAMRDARIEHEYYAYRLRNPYEE